MRRWRIVAEVRTYPARVTRLAGAKGVAVEEIRRDGEREFKSFFTVWLGEGHGLQVGDEARFYGQLSVKKTEKGDRVYVDVMVNNGQVVEGSLVRGVPAESWRPGGGGEWGE
jgi:hypothetical protein